MQDDACRSEAAESKFYSGRIEKLFRGSQSGIISSDSGRELSFEWLSLRVLGPLRQFEDLREGMQVGFDVGRTSKGLMVTVINVREEPAETETGGGKPDSPRCNADRRSRE